MTAIAYRPITYIQGSPPCTIGRQIIARKMMTGATSGKMFET